MHAMVTRNDASNKASISKILHNYYSMIITQASSVECTSVLLNEALGKWSSAGLPAGSGGRKCSSWQAACRLGGCERTPLLHRPSRPIEAVMMLKSSLPSLPDDGAILWNTELSRGSKFCTFFYKMLLRRSISLKATWIPDLNFLFWTIYCIH